MNLKDVLGEELYGQVTEALKGKGKDGKNIELAIANDGSYLPKAKFDDVNTELQGLKDQLSERDKDIAKLKKNSGANDGLETQLKELQDKYQKDTDSLNETIKTMRFDSALDMALTEAKSRNVKAVKALLNMDEIKHEDGKITGLDAQLETLKTEHDYLFTDKEGTSKTSYSYEPAKGGKANEPTDLAGALRAEMGIKN